jgi:hypothetical protein
MIVKPFKSTITGPATAVEILMAPLLEVDEEV